MAEFITLVNEHNEDIGKIEKLEAHQKGLLHRAFSVFIFNDKNELLMQQRAFEKYHSGGLWTNTCCSHPNYNEDMKSAINRRLYEEMGMVCNTSFLFSFLYKANFENGLTEHELDHVYVGKSNEIPKPNAIEVNDYKFITLQQLEIEIKSNPEKFTVWLKICLPKLISHFNLNTNLS